ncbi:hypothetical protein Tco_0327334 [Tanacetum coccineum]
MERCINTLNVADLEFRGISLTGFRSCTSRSHYRSVSQADNTQPKVSLVWSPTNKFFQAPYNPSGLELFINFLDHSSRFISVTLSPDSETMGLEYGCLRASLRLRIDLYVSGFYEGCSSFGTLDLIKDLPHAFGLTMLLVIFLKEDIKSYAFFATVRFVFCQLAFDKKCQHVFDVLDVKL